MKRLQSLFKYIALFKNWWWAALARYLKNHLGFERSLHFRDGRILIFRPGSDYVAVGEVFIPETYSPALGLNGIHEIWDVGGNIGCFVLWAAPHYPGAHFESFEPCDQTCAVLTRNAQANPAIHWDINPFGLANFDGTVDGFVPGEKFAETSRFGTDGTKVSLPLRAINQVWRGRGCPRIGLMKIDCEGGEYDIFDGIDPQLLEAIGALILEVHAVPGKDPVAIRTILETAGFKVEWSAGPGALIWASRG